MFFSKPTDIQPGISPEIVEDIPYVLDEPSKSKGFFSSLFGFSQPATNLSLQESYSHSLYEKMQNISSKIMPVGYNLTGYLTVDEFIKAGDFLVNSGNKKTWDWSFEPERMNENFPPDRQFLINRGLICESRVDLDVKEHIHLDMTNNDIWTCPERPSSKQERYHVYDVSLTYDKANRTPRIWLEGYSKEGRPLEMDEISKDINIEFVGTVATMIPHPFTGILNVSIHPCRHAEGMSRIIDQINKSENGPFNVESYLIHFLKLISCIFPTIDIS